LTTSISKVWNGEDGIGRVIFLPNSIITVDAAKDYIAAGAKLSKGKSMPVFCDLRKVKSVDRQARKYLASEEVSKLTKASAILVSSPVSRLLGSFFIGLNKPPYPVKLFTSEEEAIKWLEVYIE